MNYIYGYLTDDDLMVTCYTISIFISLGYFIFFICVSFDRVNQIFAMDKGRAVKFTLLYLLYLTLLAILFTNSPKPGKLTYLPVEIKTKID